LPNKRRGKNSANREVEKVLKKGVPGCNQNKGEIRKEKKRKRDRPGTTND